MLFLLAVLLSGTAALPQAQDIDIYLTAGAMLLTLVYGVGLIFRSRRRIAGMGVDSVTALGLYGAGVAGRFAIA